MAMEKIAEGSDSIAGNGAQAGMGMGLGVMLPGMFAQQLSHQGKNTASPPSTTQCCECKNTIPMDANFCPQCGHQQVIFEKCQSCGKNITMGTQFCPQCGKAVHEEIQPRFCAKCGAKDLGDALFCNQCGEKH
jgi:predicted amidophosphoribosyltransferase